MQWCSAMVFCLVVAAGCSPGESVSTGPTSTAPAMPAAAASQTAASQTDTSQSVSSQTDTSQPTASQPAQIEIEVLRAPATDVRSQIRELPNYGYGIRPSTLASIIEPPDIAGRFPNLAVETLDVIWGIDSSAVLVLATGEPEEVAEAKPLLTDSTSWTLGDDRWLMGLYQGGLSSGWEIDSLSATIAAIVDPESACQSSVNVCPFGEQWFPPPPPNLVSNAPVVAPAGLFEVHTITGARSIGANAIEATWIDQNDRAFSSLNQWSGPADQVDTIERGPALVIEALSNFAFIFDPGDPTGGDPFIAFRAAQGDHVETSWPVPSDWDVTGMAMLGQFRQDDYRLVVTADTDGDPVAVSLPFDEQLFMPPSGSVTNPATDSAVELAVELTDLPRLNSDGVRWSQPQRTRSGDLLIVEERRDGWYLVHYSAQHLAHYSARHTDAGLGGAGADHGQPVDLLRSSHPILSYASDGGNRNIVLAIDGPDGPTNWWVKDSIVTELEGSATSLAWLGRHTAWVDQP